MRIKYIISVFAYIAALILGTEYLYLLLAVFAFMYREKWIPKLKTATLTHLLIYGVCGGVFAVVIQSAWGLIQRYLFQVVPYSIHTNNLVSSAQTNLKMVILICVVCPILEEIIFRKILFEFFNRKIGIVGAAFISALLFSLIHFDFANIATYILIGLVFSLIYIKSKNLMNSMVSHMVMNAIILIILM
jgi:membrane protease YdiL (CAAX protease family)